MPILFRNDHPVLLAVTDKLCNTHRTLTEQMTAKKLTETKQKPWWPSANTAKNNRLTITNLLMSPIVLLYCILPIFVSWYTEIQCTIVDTTKDKWNMRFTSMIPCLWWNWPLDWFHVERSTPWRLCRQGHMGWQQHSWLHTATFLAPLVEVLLHRMCWV